MQAMKSLGRVRADRTGDARSWSPIEMLEDLLREAREGTVDLTEAIIIFDTNPGEYSIRRAGIDPATEFLMLRHQMKKLALLDD